ncbi:protein of unknown function DUF1994-containing protein [Mycolicibacterium rhodesiae JS60]|nr:protein of unknown function DUF1994-containing protein [Mycolicibacterium rhodesiae JS60]
MQLFGRRRARTAIAAAGLAIAAVAWLHPGFGDRDDTAAHASPAATASAGLTSLLSQVQVVDRIDAVPGYQRGCRKGELCVFGPAWSDPLDRSGCDARNRALRVQLRDVVFKANTRDCKVIDGYLDPDPYTGQRISLDDIDIDHLVPLRRAWDAGAWKWDLQQRRVFANDLTELVAVSSHANRSKGDSGLDEYLPLFQPCEYITRYLTVAVKYQLPITASERETARKTCG